MATATALCIHTFIHVLQCSYSGFYSDLQLASRDDFWLTTAVIPLKKGGNPVFVPTNSHGPLSEFKNIERSYGHFGPIKKCLEALILDTGFRCLE